MGFGYYPPAGGGGGGGGVTDHGALTGLVDPNDHIWVNDTYVYNSGGSQSGNRYNDWSDLIDALAAAPEGPKLVVLEQSETIPVGAWDMSGATLHGNRPTSSTLGSQVIEFGEGCTLTGLDHAMFTGGLTLYSTATTHSIVSVGTGFYQWQEDVVVCSETVPFIDFTDDGGASFLALVRNAGCVPPSLLGVGGAGVESIRHSGDGQLYVVAPTGTAPLADDQIETTGSGAEYIVNLSSSGFLAPDLSGAPWGRSHASGNATYLVGSRGSVIGLTDPGWDGNLADDLPADVQAYVDGTDKLTTVTTVGATGTTETLNLSTARAFNVTMDDDCTFTFSNPNATGTTDFILILSGAFTPTWPGSVVWPGGAEPTYTTPSVYAFFTDDGGTTWYGTQPGAGFA